MIISESLLLFLRRHKHQCIELLFLTGSLHVAAGLARDDSPAWFLPLILTFHLFAPSAKVAVAGTGELPLCKRLPIYLAVYSAGSLILYFTGHVSPAMYSFGPIWIGSMAVYLLGVQSETKFLRRKARACGEWLVRHGPLRRYDLLVAEILIIGCSAYAAVRLETATWPSIPTLLLTVITWGILRLATRAQITASWRDAVIRLLGAFLVLVVALATWLGIRQVPFSRGHGLVVFGTFLSLFLYLAASRRWLAAKGGAAENFRWVVLGLAWLWLYHPFLNILLHGTGDALWYATMLGDLLEQVRAGVFPVWVGQSEYQYNGAIYSIRVAPAFHYCGALLDALTWRTLGTFAVQNALLATQALLATATCYLSLRSLLTAHPWLACGLTILFIGCPGVMGVVYNTDLYMSWMTLPLIPLMLYASVRSFHDGRLIPLAVLGSSLGAMWWCHSPIALWCTGLAALVQMYRLAGKYPSLMEARNLLVGAVAFSAIAAYPIGSVLFFPPEPGVNASAFQEATPETIVRFLREVFPAVLLPLSEKGRALSDFQLGYALWALFAFSLWQIRTMKLRPYRALICVATLILFLLTPFPGAEQIWTLVPGVVRHTTGNWVMNRLYLIVAGFCAFGAGLAIAHWMSRQTPARLRISHVAVLLLVAWTLGEARKFAYGSTLARPAPGSDKIFSTKENAVVTRFAYLIFQALPPYFTHGTVDPQLENRLLHRDTLLLEADNATAITNAFAAGHPGVREVANGGFRITNERDRDYLEFDETLVFAPQKRYLLEFDFVHTKAAGVLTFKGGGTDRLYALPNYGEAKSFGAGGEHSPFLGFHNNSAHDQPIKICFYPEAGERLAGLPPLARVRVFSYEEDILPVNVLSWVPHYTARVRTDAERWLESPRMYQTGYRALVNGKPAEVRKSPAGLTMVAVLRGQSHVELRYEPPTTLKALFWLSLLSIIFSVTMGCGVSSLGANAHYRIPQR